MHSRQPSIASSMAHNHPAQVGPWKLGKTLGRGATGRVLLATHQSTGQKAAVKVVSKSELQDDDAPAKLSDDAGLPYGIEREIIIMKLLTHPNVLRLYDVWETSKALYLVLEYVEGGELFDLLVERGPLQEQEAIKYFRQIILGTAYCHALGICHRDLKPENLLLDGNLNVKLADFGMAALESNDKLLETSCGSPHYAAPEIVSGLKYHGSGSDIWSCGVILFALLTGRLPFDDENIRNLLLKVQAGSFEMPYEISVEAQDLIAKMLTVDPEKRIKTGNILSHPLLTKYPIPSEDLISVKSLPHPETAYKSLGSVANIDKQILQNLSILWHDRPKEQIIRSLLTEGSNPEKTFYALLMRYSHNQQEASFMSPRMNRRSIHRSNSIKGTPRKKRASQVSASTSRNRPVLFQYKNGVRGSRLSAASSVNNSPRKASPRKLSPRKSPIRSPRKYRPQQDNNTPPPAIPRNIYDEIVTAQRDGSMASMPPSLPSKDSIHRNSQGSKNPVVDEYGADHLMASASVDSPTKSKRLSGIPKSNSKNRLSRRKSLRASISNGLKRNSITMKLLSTYTKLSAETEWEYMDKQTKRTSATFASLCDKIFNQETYDEDDENLIDEEERQAREYERLMEIERKKHEAEIKARKELDKQRRRLKRKSLMSSKKLAILIKDDSNNSEQDITSEPLSQPKRGTLRSISEGGAVTKSDDLTAEELEKIKKRSVTQPTPRARKNPVLTRRPVSRLDPLWIAHENDELNRAQEALEAEYRDADLKTKKKINRESMVSVMDGYGNGTERRPSRNSYYAREEDYELPEHQLEATDLSQEYLSEIRKSRLLNSKLNINGMLEEKPLKDKRKSTQEAKSLIANVKIPNVTRKSRNFTESNKRLSVMTIRSTRESYHDLKNVLEGGDEEASKMPHMRTSFADRLNRAGLPETGEEEEEPLDEGSIMDFDEHLANKRSSYYAGDLNTKRYSKYSSGKPSSDRPNSQLPTLPNPTVRGDDYDDTFVTKNDEVRVKRKSAYSGDDLDGEAGGDNPDEDVELFDHIKLPTEKDNKEPKRVSKESRTKSMRPSASTMLIPDFDGAPQKPQPYAKVRQPKPEPPTEPKKPLVDTTNKPDPAPGKRSRSIFRKLSWGSKKTLEEPPKTSHLPSPADSREASMDEKPKSNGFFRWLSSSHQEDNVPMQNKRFNTVLPKQEMSGALFALLQSWSNFGLKDLRNDTVGYYITGAISKNNSFDMKSCKFRIKISPREYNQKSTIVCAYVKGSKTTANTLFKEIEKVLVKEGVMDK